MATFYKMSAVNKERGREKTGMPVPVPAAGADEVKEEKKEGEFPDLETFAAEWEKGKEERERWAGKIKVKAEGRKWSIYVRHELYWTNPKASKTWMN